MSDIPSEVYTQDTPSPSAPNAPADALQRMEMKIDKLDQRLERIEHPPKPPNADAHASKAAVAATFALAGLKLGAFFFGKIGLLLFDHPRAYSKNGIKGIQDLWATILTFGKDKTLVETTGSIKYTLYGTAAGTIAGPIIGAIIGWKRGDRLEKASDLFVHPIESMRKILGPAPVTEKAAILSESKPVLPSPEAHSRAYEGTVVSAPAKQLN